MGINQHDLVGAALAVGDTAMCAVASRSRGPRSQCCPAEILHESAWFLTTALPPRGRSGSPPGSQETSCVDGSVTPVPKANRAACLRHAEKAAARFRGHGALTVVEYGDDDMPEGKLTIVCDGGEVRAG